MRLHEAALLTNKALIEVESLALKGIVGESDKIPIDGLILWILTQSYRAQHNIYRDGSGGPQPPSCQANKNLGKGVPG